MVLSDYCPSGTFTYAHHQIWSAKNNYTQGYLLQFSSHVHWYELLKKVMRVNLLKHEE